jgi:hypothetical protein
MSDPVVNSEQTKLSRHTPSSTKRYEASGLAQSRVAKPQPPAPRSSS